jgi:hypothetical protein
MMMRDESEIRRKAEKHLFRHLNEIALVLVLSLISITPSTSHFYATLESQQ